MKKKVCLKGTHNFMASTYTLATINRVIVRFFHRFFARSSIQLVNLWKIIGFFFIQSMMMVKNDL